MSTERIAKVLSNCEQGLSASEQATARENIGAQGALTAGPNIDIYNDIISTEKAVLTAGSNVSVASVLDPQTRTATYTISATDTKYTAGTNITIDADNVISATDTTYNVFNTTTDGLVPKASGTGDTDKFLKGDGTWSDAGTTWAFDSGYCIDCNEIVAQGVHTISYDLNVKQDGGLAVDGTQGLYSTRTQVNSVSSSSQGPVTTPVSVMNINGAGSVTLDSNAAGFLLQAGAGSATIPVYINPSINEAVACDKSAFEGTRHELVMASSVTLDGTSNEQDWALGPQRSWPYGWSSHRFEWNGIVTSSQNLTVRFYERTFSYNGLDGTFTPDAEKLLATAYLRSGTGSVNVAFTTTGWPNRKWLSSLRVTVQPDSAASGSVTLSEQAGSYTPVNSGAEIITIPNDQPSGPWTPPNP